MSKPISLSSGFAGSTTKSLGNVSREVEDRILNRPPFLADAFNPTKMDVFTDEFSPPGAAEIAPGQDVTKNKNPFQDKHSDFAGETRQFIKKMAAAGRASDQEMLDDMDDQMHKEQSPIKPERDQFPGSKMNRLKHNDLANYENYEKNLSHSDLMNKVTDKELAGTDEALWKKAKDASQEAFGKIKWPFVMYWYEKNGGK
jgi:hypothetical protein